MKERLKNIISGLYKPARAKKEGWHGNYPSWEAALNDCGGYDDRFILDKVKDAILKVKRGEAAYERDSVAFDEHDHSEEFLGALRAASHGDELCVIDFGGSLGSQYFQYRRFFKDKKITWMVVEQQHFVDCGNREIAGEELKFFTTVEKALDYKKSEVIILSSVLPYLPQPYALIEQLKDLNFQYILIDRNAFIDGPDRLTVQVVPESIYKASYPAWFFNETKFVSKFTDKYKVTKEFMSKFSPPSVVDGVKVYWKGFLFEQR